MFKVKFIYAFLFALFSPLIFAQQIIVDGVSYSSTKQASKAIKNGSKIFLTPGVYKQGMIIKANDVELLGERGVIFDNATIGGKAALVIKGNNVLVESIECRNIKVKDKNGACIRFEGGNLTVRDLYAHDSESGVMTSKVNGYVKIEYSRFERLGNQRGFTHALYVKADLFEFSYSTILSTKKEGSGIKSRSTKTIINHSMLASLDGVDSRLVDAANYGELIIHNSILQQGKNSANNQLIAFGLEKKVPQKTIVNRVELKNNLFLLDREKPNTILKYRLAVGINVENNIFIGGATDKKAYIKNNLWFDNRSQAKLKPYPYIPDINDIERLNEYLKLVSETDE